MRVYVGSAVAVRSGAVRHRVMLVRARSTPEAVGLMTMTAESDWPSSDGWRHHIVCEEMDDLESRLAEKP